MILKNRYWETAEKTKREKRFCFRYKKVIKRFGAVGYLDKNNWMARQVRDRQEISIRMWIHFNIYLWTQFQKFNKIFELNARARVYKSINFKYFLSFVRFKIMTIQKKPNECSWICRIQEFTRTACARERIAFNWNRCWWIILSTEVNFHAHK